MQSQDPQNESGTETISPVEKEALLASNESASEENAPEPQTFLSRLGKGFTIFLRALVRLILIGLLVAGLGAAVYYGLPYINRTLIEPVQQNTIKVNELEIQISAMQTQQSDLGSRLSVVENTIETHTASIQKLEEIQASIESELQANNNSVLLELKHEVMLARAFDMLGRARLYLSQSNFGLAKEDVQSARDLLFELSTETSDEVLNQVVARLDLALGNLPQFPVVASGDLEIAWQILISDEASAVATSTPTPAPFVETATPTPFDVPSVTPTP